MRTKRTRARQHISGRALPRLRALVGGNIRACRKEQDVSQEYLGERAGLSGKFIGECERGEKSISVDSLGHIARVLRVPLVYLVSP